MDDSCAVCAETLEWVAYGACGHKEVCSTCVARLRFICDDRRCCICKTESSIVFVTKALGDYTRTISDFSVFPSELKEGRLGSYWYHEDTQAFFDDLDHYKMIRAMCRLSCSICDKMEEQSSDGPRRRGRFRNIDQLRGHLFHQHKLFMCKLCLEGRKVFICEQKLYTKSQLNQHINTGDSEVDGTESERGGFMGHPMCEFCRTPFYGDNELYTHMSTEHYTCHICQRLHPGQYEYYKDYDDLEIHFRREHFLCEDESCLSKKFVVFQSEAELKRHNALEHGGRMSRSKRSAVLQIPTSFRYRRSNEQDNRRGRGRTFRRDTSDMELSMAIQASLETANADGRLTSGAQSGTRDTSNLGETSDVDALIPPFESLPPINSEQPSRYLQALSQQSRNGTLEESSFPPLPMGPGNIQQKSHPDRQTANTMAAHIRRKNRSVSAPSSASAWPANRIPASPATSQNHAWPRVAGASGSGSSFGMSKPVTDNRMTTPRTHQHAWPAVSSTIGSPSILGQNKPDTDGVPVSSSYSNSLFVQPTSGNETSASSFNSSKRSATSKITHSSSAPDLVASGNLASSTSEFPPFSAAQARKFPPSSQSIVNTEDIQTANKSLVERIRHALEFDQDKYSAFKDISGEYRQGLIDAETYLAYVEQFGLSHLVPELARLCPDAQKQKELVEIYEANNLSNISQGHRTSGLHLKGGNGSKKGKGKCIDSGGLTSKDLLADNIISSVRKLQSNYMPSQDEVEVLSKDGYRTAKGKSVVSDESEAEVIVPGEFIKLKGQNETLSGSSESNNLGDREGKGKQRKKTSKFHRVRLGDGSVEALLNFTNSKPDPDPDPDSKEATSDGHPTEGLPVRGVWRHGGGQKLLTLSSREPKK